MSLRLSSLGLALGVGAVVGLAAACQTYDFEPVEPLAVAQVSRDVNVKSLAAKANIMLVVDQSGSMLDPVDRNAATCSNCGFSSGNPCPASCPTRITDMKQAMSGFLSEYGTTARFGLAVFPPSDPGAPAPGVDQCAAGRMWLDVSQSADVDAELQIHSEQIRTLIQGIRPNGGTPIGGTLQTLANHAALNEADGRKDFVLLLTDGLPNCNSTLNGNTCTCVATDPNSGQPFSPCIPSDNCLDQDRVVQVIQTLRQKEIQTIVVAFGADLGNALALEPLNAMAEAGGFARTCGTDAECGAGQTCDGVTDPDQKDGICSVKFFKAANAQELVTALNKIRQDIGEADPCLFEMDANPEDERFIIVAVDGEKYPSGPDTWTFTRGALETSQIQMQGQLCNKILNASEVNPVNVKIQIVEAL